MRKILTYPGLLSREALTATRFAGTRLSRARERVC
jgi:hypothetical protein